MADRRRRKSRPRNRRPTGVPQAWANSIALRELALPKFTLSPACCRASIEELRGVTAPKLRHCKTCGHHLGEERDDG